MVSLRVLCWLQAAALAWLLAESARGQYSGFITEVNLRGVTSVVKVEAICNPTSTTIVFTEGSKLPVSKTLSDLEYFIAEDIHATGYLLCVASFNTDAFSSSTTPSTMEMVVTGFTDPALESFSFTLSDYDSVASYSIGYAYDGLDSCAAFTGSRMDTSPGDVGVMNPEVQFCAPPPTPPPTLPPTAAPTTPTTAPPTATTPPPTTPPTLAPSTGAPTTAAPTPIPEIIPDPDKLSAGALAAIIISSVVFVACIVAWLCLSKRSPCAKDHKI